MNKTGLVLLGVVLAGTAPTRAFSADAASCPVDNGGVPPEANTADKAAPFFIGTAGLDLHTTPPTRDPANPAYPHATALRDGTIPSPSQRGNFIIGATHPVAADTVAKTGVPHGTVHTFTMTSADSLTYRPGYVRDDAPDCRNSAIAHAPTAPGDRSDMIVTTSHAGDWTRTVDVYVPAGVSTAKPMPFLVFGDGGAGGFTNETQLFTTLDNLIHERRIADLPNRAESAHGRARQRQHARRGADSAAFHGGHPLVSVVGRRQ